MNRLLGLTAVALSIPMMHADARLLDETSSQPNLVNVPGIEYPTMARAARVSGDVHLTLLIRKDGSVESATATDGPAMLRPASIAAAKTFTFDCGQCSLESNSYAITLQFRFVPTDPAKSYKDWRMPTILTAVESSGHVITVSTGEIWTCDPAVELKIVRFRAPMCLYLWRCGIHKTELTLE